LHFCGFGDIFLLTFNLMATPEKLLGKNKKAYFDYEVVEKYETGIVLVGAEVKSIKAGRVQLKGSFASVKNNRVFLDNMHVSPYGPSNNKEYDPLRRKELLLKRKEIDYLAGMSDEKGLTLVPLEIYLKKGLVKVLLGVCRGKKMHDKRAVLKKRAISKEINQGLKIFSR